jgi:FtsP/CotA-like multicopper oxidase with cupredoxin domain
MVYGTTTVSINGATASVDMDSLTELLESQTIQATQNQIWHNIILKVTGGTVSPIICTAAYTDGATAQPIVQVNVTNPGILHISGLFAPNNIDIRLGTSTNGGAGDTFQVYATGVQQPAGIPILPVSPTWQVGAI